MNGQHDKGAQWAAIILAIGISLAVTLVTAGVLYDAIFSEGPGLSDNATTLLTTAFGGIIGVLGSYMGFRAAANSNGNGSQLVNYPKELPVETPTEHIPPNEGDEQTPNGGQQGEDVEPNAEPDEPGDHEDNADG